MEHKPTIDVNLVTQKLDEKGRKEFRCPFCKRLNSMSLLENEVKIPIQVTQAAKAEFPTIMLVCDYCGNCQIFAQTFLCDLFTAGDEGEQ